MADIFALDLAGRRDLDRRAADNPMVPRDLPLNTWAGLGDQAKQLMVQSARSGRTILEQGRHLATAIDAFDSVHDLTAGAGPGRAFALSHARESTDVRDMYEGAVVEGIGDRAVDYWTPSPESTGTSAQVVGAVLQVVGSVPQIATMPGLFLADSAASPMREVKRAGGSDEAAASVGAVSLGVNAVGMRLPAAWGNNLATRMATGAGANLALGAGQDAATQQVLEADGLDDLAAAYDPLNAQGRILDTVMGLAFGGVAHLQAGRPTVPQSTRDSVLAARNAAYFAERTLPGAPKVAAATVQHEYAMERALEQMANGQPINVEGLVNLNEFVLRPEAMAGAQGFDAAVARVLDDEGGFVNDPDDRGGMTNFGISQRANPDVDVAKLTREDAAEIYRDRYWEPIDADSLPADLQGVAFDSAVNHGVGWTRRALAEAAGDRQKFIALREARYRAIVEDDPRQRKFLDGWMARLQRYRAEPAAPRAFDPVSEVQATLLPGEQAPLIFPNVERASLALAMDESPAVAALLKSAPADGLDFDQFSTWVRKQDVPGHALAKDDIALRGMYESWQARANRRTTGAATPQPESRKRRAMRTLGLVDDAPANRDPMDDGVLGEASRRIQEAPGLQVLDGFDADGAPTYRSASDVLAEIQTERTRAEAEAGAYTAAASCFLRRGFHAS